MRSRTLDRSYIRDVRAAAAGRWLRLGLLVLTLQVSAACDRGCLTKRWIKAHSGASSPDGRGEAPMDLAGTDCSDGLLRCKDGTVEASVRAVLPPSCAQTRPEGACLCPWETVARCRAACALDGVEVIASTDAGRMQLCGPEAPVARPILPGDPPSTGVCAAEGVRCVDSVVRSCESPGLPPRAYAYCLNGCEPSVSLDEGLTPGWTNRTADGVVAILCRRDHAERR